MSKTVIFSVLIVFSVSSAYATQSKTGCEIKQKTLEKQLQYAQADNDERLIKGLTRSLEYTKTTCALEKRLQDQNNKSETVKDNIKNNVKGNLADKNGSPSLQPPKSKKIDIRKNHKKK
ncbi:DUF1090 family protein [Xenorhabdus kozodoii]|nr:DUF1090 family protein [Xenorhabdus kozodoii]